MGLRPLMTERRFAGLILMRENGPHVLRSRAWGPRRAHRRSRARSSPSSLGKANINIIGYLVQAQGEYGIVRLITSDPAKTEGWLRQTNRMHHVNDVVWTPVKPQPGELGRIAATLSKSSVNITATYPTENGGLAFCVDNVPSARKALGG